MAAEEPLFADENPLALEATAWFLRVEEGNAPLDILMAWQRWLESSEANRAAYEEIQRTWHALNGIPSVPWPSDAQVVQDRYEGDTSIVRWQSTHESTQGSLTDTSPVSLSARHGGRRIGAPGWLPVAALAATVLIVVAFFSYPSPQSGAAFHTSLSTGVSEQRETVLPDGSRVTLGARSTVDIAFTRGRRNVQLLSGEGFFVVAKDAARPFVVNAGLGQVTAIGTAFNVRRYPTAVAVQVAEGQVRLDAVGTSGESAAPSLSATTTLRQGQEAVLDSGGALQTIRQVPARDVAAWREGRHAYLDEPLSTVIADLNRYTTRRVVIDDPALGGLHITTTFLSDDWRGWLDTLEAAVPTLEVHDGGDTVRISMRRGLPPTENVRVPSQ